MSNRYVPPLLFEISEVPCGVPYSLSLQFTPGCAQISLESVFTEAKAAWHASVCIVSG